jgi:hypothetical protein
MKKILILIAMFSVSLVGLTSADVWDLNTDMDSSVNDNGIWSYGYAEGDPNDPNAIPPYTGLMHTLEGQPGLWIKVWYPVPVNVTNWHPHLWKDAMGVPTGWHGYKPGWRNFADVPDAPNAQVPSLIRWTAPASFATAGVINMDATIYPTAGLVEVYIVKSVAGDPQQRTLVLQQKDVVPESPVVFSGSIDVVAGDTLDFMAGPQGPQDPATWNSTDWCAVSVTISDSCTSQLPMDFNWDCYVNLADFAIFAQSWLDCNNPNDPSCD